jgi:hypothetical protein
VRARTSVAIGWGGGQAGAAGLALHLTFEDFFVSPIAAMWSASKAWRSPSV